MNETISSKLLNFQLAHTLQLNESIGQNHVTIDASDTGTGKTYTAMALCAINGLSPLVICPKSVISNWFYVASVFGVDAKVSNYELIKGGHYYTTGYIKHACDYFEKRTVFDAQTHRMEIAELVCKPANLPANTLIIFDEAHRCKNKKTINSMLLECLAHRDLKCLLLSATITDKIETFDIFGVILGLYEKGAGKLKSWIRQKKQANAVHYRVMCVERNLDAGDVTICVIHDALFPMYGSRMKIKELGDLFPTNTISSDCYYMDNFEEVDRIYNDINLVMNKLKVQEYNAHCILAQLVRAKQRIELLKVPLYVELVKESLEAGYSVVVFVNYVETLEQICSSLKTGCVIRGGQSVQDRIDNIEQFQSNKSRIIVTMIQAGGVGISLHDLHGGYPRKSIISPTWSGQDLVQLLGRIHRAGAKTPAIQSIVYCAKTYEERICEIIKTKLKNISGINDGDLFGLEIERVELNKTEENQDKSYQKITTEIYRELTEGQPFEVVDEHSRPKRRGGDGFPDILTEFRDKQFDEKLFGEKAREELYFNPVLK